MEYVVMNAEGFQDPYEPVLRKRGETITFESIDDVNQAIAEGAELALPHASPGVALPQRFEPTDDPPHEPAPVDDLKEID